MTIQPEQVLENNLVAQLIQLGYENAEGRDERTLLTNLSQVYKAVFVVDRKDLDTHTTTSSTVSVRGALMELR